MRYGITEGLFKFNDNMEVEPWLADSYTVNDEHTEWVITLKDGVKFSDGCDLTPTKVKEYFEYLKEMGPSGSAKPQKYLEFEATITADDEANTLTIQTTSPTRTCRDSWHIRPWPSSMWPIPRTSTTAPSVPARI